MKKLSLVLALVLASLATALAQRTITGTVTDDNGEPLIGASILVRGTTVGTVTDIDGTYSLEVPEGADALLVSYTGYSTKEITLDASNVVDITLVYDVLKLDEVVVTATGIERQRRDLGYSVTTIGGEEFTVARETNVVNSLQGKTSGVLITQQSGNLGGSTKILIRGVNSLGGSNQPLWVVDGVPVFDSNISTGSRITGGFDVGNRAQDINPDDIESISILKGAAAAALYGSRAANGAIIVTTKKGKKGDAANIQINSTFRVNDPLRLPDFQNQYAQGTNGKFSTDFLNGWGPAIDGREVTDFTGETSRLQAFPDNVRDFYETGTTLINNVAVGGGSENSNYRFSATQLNQTGIFPNSELDRTTLSFNAGQKFTQKINSSFGINLVRTTSGGSVAQGGNDPNVLSSIINGMPRNVDIGLLTPWIDESTGVGEQLNPLTENTNNPYWIAHENLFTTEVDRVYGNFALSYEPVFWFDITSRLGYDFVTDDRFRSNRVGTLGRLQGDFTDDRIQQRQLDYNLLATAKTDLSEDLFIKGIVGFNYNTRVLERVTNFAQELTVEQLFSYGNVNVNNPTNDFSERRLFGFFGDITLSYREWLSLNITGRNDWSSTLPKDNNSYFYPSASLSFIFTDALQMNSNILSYGKFRLAYAEVGGDTDPYQLNFNYFPQVDAFGQFGTGTAFPFNGTLAFSGPGTVPPDNLLPESVNSFEVGGEFQLFNGRIGIDATYYNVKTTDQILAIPIPESTGFNFRLTNVGATTNEGVEIELTADIIRNRSINWNTLFTATRNQFLVDELADGVDRLIINSGFNSIQIVASPGESFGLFGTKFRRAESDSTKIIVDPNTGLRLAGETERIGNVFPDWVIGWSNNFSWKGLNLRFTFDMRDGGLLYSNTVQGLRNDGLAVETGANREASFVDTEAFIEQPDGTLVPNDIPVRAQDFWQAYTAQAIAEGHVFDASFIKLREVGLSYNLPKRLLDRTPFKGISIGVEARNLALIWSEIPHIDPETNLFGSANDGAGIEFQSPPTSRTYGVNLRLQF